MRRSEQTKKILRELNINENINFPYFLDKISENSISIDELRSLLQEISYNQRALDRKLDLIINLISNSSRR